MIITRKVPFLLSKYYPNYFLGDDAVFESLDLKIPVAKIYRRVDNEDMQEFLLAAAGQENAIKHESK